jgi:UDP:flavonoid glycosyltransferase YjiC (YdhE family)
VLAVGRELGDLAAAHGVELQRGVGLGAPASLNIVFIPASSSRRETPSTTGSGSSAPPRRAARTTPAGRRRTGRCCSSPSAPRSTTGPRFYRACLEAFADQGPVTMAVGQYVRVDDLGTIPGNVDVRPWFPQPAVLRHAAAFVSHAGMGSTMEALCYGVPLVCVPQMLEQEANARRVAELGLGVRLDAEHLIADDLRAAVDAVTTDDGDAGALDRMRDAVRTAGGAVAAADAIEAHLT